MSECAVLLVDDDDDIREAVADALVDSGHRVIHARNGKEALGALEDSNELPGLILLDLMMPVMDGAEFRVRQRAHEQWSSIPVVVLSADNTAAKRAAKMDVAACYQKPIKLGTLLDAVDRFCVSSSRR
ncbi:MAG TPA: response regulator [Kofleriaceae bacterium]|nr:response regulator [Kofleriaceae bacterium]